MFQSPVYAVPASHESVCDALGPRLELGLAALTHTDGLAVAPVAYDVRAVAVLRFLGPLTGATVDEVLEAVQRRALRLAADEARDAQA